MNVYDFDNTIYDGESAIDFFKFCLKSDKRLIRMLPLMIVKLAKYKLCMISIDELETYIEKYAVSFINRYDNLDLMLEHFWKEHYSKIKAFYIEQKQPNDIIISASFKFLLEIPIKKLGITNLICSDINVRTGQLNNLCFRENKVELLKELVDNGKDINFYTDSMNDKPLIDFSEHAYLVKGNKIKKLK